MPCSMIGTEDYTQWRTGKKSLLLFPYLSSFNYPSYIHNSEYGRVLVIAIQNKMYTIRFESIERFLLSGQNYDLFVISMIRIENKKRKTNGS